ncbi:MAG: hypothetical protein PWQ95_1399 [Thermococcaceae archaeon]|nr:hypothetical protein [Thermococcaceae archaeon]
MKKLSALFIFLLILPLAHGDTVSVILHPGETIIVNGVEVTLIDISSTGEAMFSIDGRNRLLTFGEGVEIKEKNITILLGRVFLNEAKVRVIIDGPSIFVNPSSGKLEMYSPFPSKTTVPLGTVTFTVTIQNLGSAGFYPINVKAPIGWDVRLTAEGSEVDGVYLKEGESTTLSVVAKVGEKPGQYTITLTSGGSSLRLSVRVEEPKLSAFVQYPEKETEAGETLTFTLHLSSDEPILVPLSASAPEGWEVKFLAGDEGVRSVYLTGDLDLAVRVYVPSDAPVGRHEVRIKAGGAEQVLYVYVTKTHAGENGTLSVKVIDTTSGSYLAGAKVALYNGSAEIASSKSLTVNLMKLPYCFSVDVQSPSKSGTLGETFTYPVRIANLGENDDSYSLKLSVPEGWAGLITESPGTKQGITSVYVEAGSERQLYVVLIPPNTAELGTYESILEVTSDNTGEKKVFYLSSSITGNYDLTVSLEKYSLTVDAGKTATLKVKVYNTGTSPITNVEVKAEAPENWKVKITPERIVELKKNDVAVFNLEITVPAKVDAGDYVVSLKALSDQKQGTERIRVTVKKGRGGTYVGLGIILGALIVLAILLKKYGRR